MKMSVLKKVYADFECINLPQTKVIIKQMPIAVVYYKNSPFGKQYYSYVGLDRVNWFVIEFF